MTYISVIISCQYVYKPCRYLDNSTKLKRLFELKKIQNMFPPYMSKSNTERALKYI